MGIFSKGKQGRSLLIKNNRKALKFGTKILGVSDALGGTDGILKVLDGNLVRIWGAEDHCHMDIRDDNGNYVSLSERGSLI